MVRRDHTDAELYGWLTFATKYWWEMRFILCHCRWSRPLTGTKRNLIWGILIFWCRRFKTSMFFLWGKCYTRFHCPRFTARFQPLFLFTNNGDYNMEMAGESEDGHFTYSSSNCGCKFNILPPEVLIALSGHQICNANCSWCRINLSNSNEDRKCWYFYLSSLNCPKPGALNKLHLLT